MKPTFLLVFILLIVGSLKTDGKQPSKESNEESKESKEIGNSTQKEIITTALSTKPKTKQKKSPPKVIQVQIQDKNKSQEEDKNIYLTSPAELPVDEIHSSNVSTKINEKLTTSSNTTVTTDLEQLEQPQNLSNSSLVPGNFSELMSEQTSSSLSISTHCMVSGLILFSSSLGIYVNLL